MPVSVVVGGQFGSEGKGKVSAWIARTTAASALVRVGGPNSGHTAVDEHGRTWTLRQLPAALVTSGAPVVLPAGSLIDVEILLEEIGSTGIAADRVWIDPRASIVTADHKRIEESLVGMIGSTASGTGAALRQRIERRSDHLRAGQHPALAGYITPDVPRRLREMLQRNARVIIEGTQGFGLSLWHTDHYPFATSRDTTAATFVAEAGLAPHDVDETVLVLRTFPIRVGGNSGLLANEIDWPTLANEASLPADYQELTSATKRVRRVGRFDPTLVRHAVDANAPHRIVLNHMDYVDPNWRDSGPTLKSREFLDVVERGIGRRIDLIGYSADVLLDRQSVMMERAA